MRCLHNHDSLIMCLFSMMVLIQPCPWTLSMITNGLANGKSLLHDNSVPLIFNSNVFFYVHKVRFALWVYQQLTRVMFSYWFLTSSNTLLIIFIISFIIMIMIMASLYSSPGGSAWWKPASCERPRRSPWRPPGWSAGRPRGARPTRGICAPLPRPRRSPRRAPSSRDRPWCWLFSPPWLQDLFSLGEHLHELAARAFRREHERGPSQLLALGYDQPVQYPHKLVPPFLSRFRSRARVLLSSPCPVLPPYSSVHPLINA